MNEVLQGVLQEKIIAIIRGVKSSDILPAVEALYRGGIRFVEVTYTPGDVSASMDTLKSIQLLQEHFSGCMHIGAGTVLSAKDVERAEAVGAEFIISPNMNLAVIRRTKELGLISIPGAYTPTEVQSAWEGGADIVKIFPADQLGPQYFRALKKPLSQLRLAAVGGISDKNIGEFLAAGVDGFGISSALVSADRVKRDAWDEIQQAARTYVTAAR